MLYLPFLLLFAFSAFADDAEWDEPVIHDEPLRLFATPPVEPAPHITSRLTLDPATPWVAITQCHRGMEPFPRVEVVYRYERMRELRVTSSEKIDGTRVVGNSVQLDGVERNATLCVELEAAILHSDGDGGYRLHQGPYHRRFLDGWFPLRLTLEIRGGALRITAMEPPPEPGLSLTQSEEGAVIEALFAGELELDFRLVNR